MVERCKKCVYYKGSRTGLVDCYKKGAILIPDDPKETEMIYCLDFKEGHTKTGVTQTQPPKPSQPPEVSESQLSQCEDCAYRLAWLPGKIRCKHKGIITSSSDIPYTTCEYYDKKDEEDFQMPKSGTTIKVPLQSENFERFTDDMDKTTFFDVVEFLTWNLPSNPTYLVGDMLKHLMNYNVHRDTVELEMVSTCLAELLKYESSDNK